MNTVPRSPVDDPPDFNALANVYRWMEMASFGPLLQWCRCVFLPELRSARHALVIGDGDGRFTAQLLLTNPHIKIDAVDASSAMLHQLLRRAKQHANRVNAICADARLLQPANPPYDLVVTHFFLDCLTAGEIDALAETVRGSVGPSALWLVSEFAIPHGLYGQFIARPLIAGLYWTFGQLTGLKVRALSDHRAPLTSAGFTRRRARSWLGGLLISELWTN